MTRKQLQNNWRKLFKEIQTKPKIKTPYPPKVVILRELLLFAEMTLNKIQVGDSVDFYTTLHQKVMRFYYQQKKCLKI